MEVEFKTVKGPNINDKQEKRVVEIETMSDGWTSFIDGYYVSTRNTKDHGWETMIFRAKGKRDDMINWHEIYQDMYTNDKVAYEAHKNLVTRIANGDVTFLEGEENE